MRSKPILAAIKAAGQGKTIVNIVSNFLGHPRSAVRVGVVRTLNALGGAAKSSDALLVKRLGVETDGGIRSIIAGMLGQHNRAAKPAARVNTVGRALAKVASDDKDWAARASAAEALGFIGPAVARQAVPAFISLIADGRRRMAHIKRTCMELSDECDSRTDKYYDAMEKARIVIQMRMGRGKVVWSELIKLWSHDDELIRSFSASLWANMFWDSTYQDLPE